MPKATMKKPAEKPKPPDKKPEPPWKPFPLFFHQTKQWAKKIRGKTHYFGTDAEAAEKRYQEVKDDLHAGRTPRPKSDGGGLTLDDLINEFLTAKKRKMDAGELDGRTFGEYFGAADRLIAAFGRTRLVSDLRATDFGAYRNQLTGRFGPAALTREITMARMVFKFGFDNDLILVPVKFGSEFSKPKPVALRKVKQAQGMRTMEAKELRKLLKLAGPQMKAMVLLGLNCGYGNFDVATLPLSALDLAKGVVDYPRQKTRVERRAMLWPETIAALKAVVASRPKSVDPAAEQLVFITKFGKSWVRQVQTLNDDGDVKSMKVSRTDAVAGEFTKLLTKAGLRREGVGFYSLRHVFRTIADEIPDRAAIDRVMGHTDKTMAAHYREWKRDAREDARLKAVTDHVRAWLFGARGKK